MKRHDKKEFKYLSKERIQEVHQIFETFKQTNWKSFPNRNSYYRQNFYEANKPFKKFSMLQYEGIDLKLTSSS